MPRVPRLNRRTFLGAALATGMGAKCRAADQAERQLAVVNARVFAAPQADAILIRGNRIAAIGRRATLQSSWDAGTTRLDARGGLVVPGFNDAHLHMHSGGETLQQLDLTPYQDLPAALAAIARYDQTHPGNSWFKARGWKYSLAPPGKFPTRQDLDRVLPNRPAILRSYDGHTTWVNSRALALAEVGPDTADPPQGAIIREADGKTPSGILTELAGALVKRVVPKPTKSEMLANLAAAVTHCVRLGLTSATDVYCDVEELELYRELEATDRLPLRIAVSLPLEGDLDHYVELRAKLNSRLLRLGFLKDFLDGVIESKTAYMLAPYAGTNDRGKPMLGRELLDQRLEAARRRGFSVGLHAIGDAATRLALDAFAAAPSGEPLNPLRGRLEHLEIVDPADLPRFRAAGVVASMQPVHAKPESAQPDEGAWSVLLGSQRLPHSFPWRKLLDAGATLAFGSDWPVMSADPLWGVAVATTRKNEAGDPAQGWNAHQCITADEAIRAYTEGSAVAEGVAAERGRLQVGHLADLVVLAPTVDLREPASLWEGQRIQYVVVDGQVRVGGDR